jgi:hypothetical protein
MKWIKRIIVFLVILVIGLAALLGTSYYLIHRTPEWYKPLAMNSEEMEAAANRAFNKVAAIHNMADQAAAQESASAHNPKVATRPDIKPITVTFTQEELTAFILRWSTLNSEMVDKYVKGPQFVLQDGQIIFGGQVADLGQFVSLHLEPSLDEKGMLNLDMSIKAGKLPLPRATIESKLSKAQATLERWLPEWQKNAKIEAGGANSDAVKAAMTELLLNTLNEKPSQPVFFMPIGDRKTVPVKLTDISVDKGSVTLTVQPLSTSDRKAALLSFRILRDRACGGRE